ncbi:MAG: hypothetical protein ACPGUU_05775 [Flavobacteriaceae bacterium]
MRIKITLIFIVFFLHNSFTQSKDWYSYDLDSVVSLDMPFDVYETDSISEYQKSLQLFSEDESTKFIAKKTYIGKRYNNIETPTLPVNKKTLNKFYLDLIDIFDVIIKSDFDYQKKIYKNNLLGYEVCYKNKEGLRVLQIQLFYINKSLYTFSYLNSKGLSNINKENFFDSIIFNNKEKLIQYPGMSLERKFIIGLLIILVLSFLYRLKS